MLGSPFIVEKCSHLIASLKFVYNRAEIIEIQASKMHMKEK